MRGPLDGRLTAANSFGLTRPTEFWASPEKQILHSTWYSKEFTLRIEIACKSSKTALLRTAWIWISNIEFSCLTGSSDTFMWLRMQEETTPATSNMSV